MMAELTGPWEEEGMESAFQRKRTKHTELGAECCLGNHCLPLFTSIPAIFQSREGRGAHITQKKLLLF